MDKKTKKKLQALREKQKRLRQQIAGVRKQCDDPAELAALEKEEAKITAEIDKLKEQ